MRCITIWRAGKVTLDPRLAPWVVSKLLCMLMLVGCAYEAPVYHGEIEAVTLLGDGRLAVGYSQEVSRRPTDLSAWPDGGRARILHDQFLVAMVDLNGGTREIIRFENEAIPGSGAIKVDWFEDDPAHLYVTHTGQLTTALPLGRLNQIRRIELDGRELARFDPQHELAAQGRDYTGMRSADAGGAMLAAAARDGTHEMWRRDGNGSWTLLDQSEGHFDLVGADLVFRRGNYQMARNWRSGEVRKLVYFDPATQRSEIISPADPALAYSGYQPTKSAWRSSDRKAVHIMRDNDRIASIAPDFRVLDRR